MRALFVLYVVLLVILPLGLVVAHAFSDGPRLVWDAITDPVAVQALALTLGSGLAVAGIQALIGLAVAWALVRVTLDNELVSRRSDEHFRALIQNATDVIIVLDEGNQVSYAATVAIVMGVVTAIIAYVVQLRGTRRDT